MEEKKREKRGRTLSMTSIKTMVNEEKVSLTTRFKSYFGIGGYEGKDTWFSKNWWLFLALVGIFLFGLFLRSYFYFPRANDVGFSGNDPFYHKRVVDFVQDTHSHLIEDPMLNYPVGGVNPRPPFYNWFVAIFGIILSPLFGFNVEISTNTLMYLAPSFWGALTAIPVYFISKEMFGKKTGVISALLMATMPSHIERSPAGFSDHDSIVVFFVVLSIFLLFRAFRALKHEDWVKNWKSSNSIYLGFSRFFRKNKVAVYYSLLSGVSLAAIALTWKGFPYALVIIIIYYMLQILIDRFRHVDSTGIFVCIFLALFTSLALSFPYYSVLSFGTWSTPFYFLAAIVVIGLLLIPTRDYPWIIVLPLGLIASIVGYLMLSIIAPSAAEALITGQGYFVKSKLYSTIAEAQPPQFSRLIVSYAMLTFFLAVIGIVKAAFQVPKHWKREYVFIVLWAIVAVYMAMAAVRFMFNATPVIAIVAGWVLYDLIKKINTKSKILIFYTLALGMSMLLLGWWGVFHGFGDQYTWLVFMGALGMWLIPVIVAIYDNYDKRPAFLLMGVTLAVWTLSVIMMLIIDTDFKWGTIGDAIFVNANILYLGLAGLGIVVLPILIFMAKRTYAVLHIIIVLALTLLIVELKDVGSFDELFSWEPLAIVFRYSIIPFLVLIFNVAFLFLDKTYRKESARKVLFVGLEVWVLTFFFNPNPYMGLATFALLVVNIYLLTPYRKSFKHKTKPMHVVITLFITLFILLPQFWFAIDASLPYEDKWEMNNNVYKTIPDFLHPEDANKNKYFGAFGHGFTSEYWRSAFEWLSKQDMELSPEDRPGFVSWWDYGFWCVYLGEHPTAADNFQFGYQFAGSFIASQNESEAIGLMIARGIEGGILDSKARGEIADILDSEKYFGPGDNYESNIDSSEISASEKIFEMVQRPEKYVNEVKNDPEKYGKYLQLLPGNARYAAVRGMLMGLGEERIVDLMVDIHEATDKCIRYFAVDYRLFPFTAQNTGIFYAPIKLADKDVGDFLEYAVVLDDGRQIGIDEFENMVEADPTLRERVVDYKLKYTDQFYNSMFYKCYIGYSAMDLGEEDMGVPIVAPSGKFKDQQNYFQPMQGWNLSHFKVVYRTTYYTPKEPENATFPEDYTAMNSDEAIELYRDQGGYQISGLRQGAFFLKYYHGAYLRGKVRTEGEDGVPMPGVKVVVSDEYGIPHDECVTDAGGNYNLTVPFGEMTVTASKDGFESGENELFSRLLKNEKTVLNRTTITVSDEQSMRQGDWIIEKDLLLKRGSVDGKLFLDNNSNDQFDQSEDMYLEDAEVILRSNDERNISYSVMTGEDGAFNFTNVLPAQYNFSARTSGHLVDTTATVEITGDSTEEYKDVAIALGIISGNVTFNNESGAPYASVWMRDMESGTTSKTLTNGTGFYRFDRLLSGNYTVVLEQQLYRREEVEIELEAGSNFLQNFTLVEVVPVSGKVYFDSFGDGMDENDGLVGAKVKFSDMMDLSNVVIVSSDKEGNYRTNLSIGNYSIYVHYIRDKEHLTSIDEGRFSAGTQYIKDLEMQRSIKVFGTLINENLSFEEEEQVEGGGKENATKGMIVIFRNLEITIGVPTNGSSYYTVYLPEGEYFISAEVFIPQGAAVAVGHVVGKGGEEFRVDLEPLTASPVHGFVFWDRNGDMNLTIGNQTFDVVNISEQMRVTQPGMPDPYGEQPFSPDEYDQTTQAIDEAPTRNGEDIPENLEGNISVEIGNETGENETEDYLLYENLTPPTVFMKNENMEFWITTNETGFFLMIVPEGDYELVIESEEIETYVANISVKKSEEEPIIPPIRPRNITVNILMGVDRDLDDMLSPGELLEAYDIEFTGTSPGAVNASYNYRKGDAKQASIVPGDYRVRYYKEYLLSGTDVRHEMNLNVSLGLGEKNRELTFFVDETVRFKGQARTETDEPAINVTLYLNSTYTDSATEVVCDARGDFDDYIPIGTYFVRAEHHAGSTVFLSRKVMDIAPGNSPSSVILTKAHIFNLTVYFDEDQDMMFQSKEKRINVPVTISGDITSTHTSDYNGKISTSLLPGKTYTISMDHLSSDSSQKFTGTKTITMPENPFDDYLSVTKYLKVTGKVYWDKDFDASFDTEEKVQNATLNFSFEGGAGAYEATTNADGEWNTFLPVYYDSAMEYDINVMGQNFVSKTIVQNVSITNKAFDIRLDPRPVRYYGMVFKDMNGNGTMDPGEESLPMLKMTFETDSKTGMNFTNTSESNGYYEAYIHPGEYTLDAMVISDDIYILETKETVVLSGEKRFDIPLKKGAYIYGRVSYIDTDGVEHKNIDSQENNITIEGVENGVKRELDFAEGYYETYLPYGDYQFEMKGYTMEEYGMDMVYEYRLNTITVNEDMDYFDLFLSKREDRSLDFFILNLVDREYLETTINQGEKVELELIIENVGNVRHDSITINGEDLPDGWMLNITPREVELDLGEWVKAKVTVETTFDAYRVNEFIIKADSTMAVEREVELKINTHPKFDVDVSTPDKIDNRGFKANESINFNITVENKGNAGDEIRFFLKKDAPGPWNISIQGETLNRTGYVHEYAQDDIFKNVTLKVTSPNVTKDSASFEIGVEGLGVNKTILLTATITKPDIFVKDVEFRNLDLSDKDANITMIVTLHSSYADARMFDLAFKLDGEVIMEFGTTISLVDQDTDHKLNFEWNLSGDRGKHKLEIIVDEDDVIPEISEYNNVLTESIYVGQKKDDDFNWRIVIAIGVVTVILIVSLVVWKKKQIV